MKTYAGILGTSPAVTVTDDDGTRPLLGDFGWGKGNPKARELAKAILIDHLRSTDDATKFYGRFAWRTTLGWEADKPWQITSDAIDAMLTEWRTDDPLLARLRAQVNAAVPPRVSEGGPGLSAIEKR